MCHSMVFFIAMCTGLCHYVVFLVPHVGVCVTCGLKTLLGGAEPTRVNWYLASVMCLGIFTWWLMRETHYN